MVNFELEHYLFLMGELLDHGVNDAQRCFTEKGIRIIEEISDFAKTTKVYQENKEQGDAFFESMNSWTIYVHLLQKIVNAPTTMHRDVSVILTIPYLNDAIKKERELT